MIREENYEKARKQIERDSGEGKKVFVQGESIDFNRLVLENKKVDMLVISHTNKKDKLKQRDSGLNEVLCRLAQRNDITLAFDMRELEIEDKKERGKIIGRMMQNIFLIKKSGNKLKLLNFNTKEGGFSFLISLGADTRTAKQAVI